MTIWLTSDTHFGHAMVAQLRGFDNVDQHNQTILRHINKTVRPSDTLWILGDIALGGWKDNIGILKSIQCDQIHILLGNHDRPHPSMSSAHNHMADFMSLSGCNSAQTVAQIQYNGTAYLASHFPYQGDHGTDRFTQYRLIDEGQPLFHGHTHGTERVTLSSNDTPQFHVGLDAWNLYPVSIHDAISA